MRQVVRFTLGAVVALASSAGATGCHPRTTAAQAPTPRPSSANGSVDPTQQGTPDAARAEAPGDETSDPLAKDEGEDHDVDLEPEAESMPPGLAALAPASRYAALDRDACEAELATRKILHDRVGEARGVVAPLRLRGPLSGVTYRSVLPAAKRETATIEIYDCRLVLALDDFAKILGRHDIVEVVHLSVYRPVGSKVKLTGPGRRHTGALAIDAAIFKTKDGRSLSVEKDFHGRIGAKPCPPPPKASELRTIACEAHDARLFNVLLTPNYNWPHRNHFHMEVTANVRWTLVR